VKLQVFDPELPVILAELQVLVFESLDGIAQGGDLGLQSVPFLVPPLAVVVQYDSALLSNQVFYPAPACFETTALVIPDCVDRSLLFGQLLLEAHGLRTTGAGRAAAR
jgi:hypothetical protein